MSKETEGWLIAMLKIAGIIAGFILLVLSIIGGIIFALVKVSSCMVR